MADSLPARPGAEPESAGATWAGPPLRSTIAFLSVPAALGLGILVLDLRLPGPALYAFAGVFGLALLMRTFRDPEWLLAVAVLYIPLNRMFVVPLGPGLNGTNALLALLLLAWVVDASRRGGPLFVPMPNSRLVGLWCAVTSFSVVTAGFAFGFGTVLGDHALDIKGWLDNFLVFFAFLHLIRGGAMARRVVLYMMIGAVLVLGLGLEEWLVKRWAASIEKARLLGPQLQPNDFGAFLVYISGPFLGLFLTRLGKVRTWLLVPYFLGLAKVLLATFSRGAYIGAAVAGVAAAWVRGRTFLVVTALLGALLLVTFPELIPGSFAARMGQTTTDSGEVDGSSQVRLVLWNAAIAMSLESPILGKGFKAFPRLKGQYTEVDVRESDNHNMFLYISSQMGIPALLMFLWLLYRTYRLGARVYRAGGDRFRRAIGLGGAAMAAGVVAVNMFGSRMVDLSVCAYFWIYLAALAHLWREIEAEERPTAAVAAVPFQEGVAGSP
jgi:O-antigen ligase